MSRKKTASRTKEYDSVRKAIDRKKKKISSLSDNINGYIYQGKKVPNGLRGKLSALQNELVELNKKFINVSREVGIGNRKREKITAKTHPKEKGKTVYDRTVWEAENVLKDFIKQEFFNKIYLVNTGKVFKYPYTSGLILGAFDRIRNDAYNKRNATTPFCTITEKLELKQVSFHVLS